VALDTSAGRIVIELDPAHAPKSVENFLGYVRAHQYDGLIFHRVIPGFMIQGGGYDTKMLEKPTRAPIPNEAANGLKNQAGTVAMARTAALDSATDQFFINVHDNEFLDHLDVPAEGLTVTRRGQEMHLTPRDAERVFGYAVFGRVVEGMDVVHAIEAAPTTSSGAFQNVPIKPVVIKTATLLP
jgi:cyclophilin family peptidyl-prolyl cis-trans isomerase